MKYILYYTKRSRKDLEAFNSKTIEFIVQKLEYFSIQSNPFNYAKSLSGHFKNLYRFRIGDYRAIFLKKPNGKITILTILRIKHRKDIY